MTNWREIQIIGKRIRLLEEIINLNMDFIIQGRKIDEEDLQELTHQCNSGKIARYLEQAKELKLDTEPWEYQLVPGITVNVPEYIQSLLEKYKE